MEPRRLSGMLWILAALLFLAVALVAWLEVRPMLAPDIARWASASSACALREGPCEARFADGSRVTFELTPRHIPAARELVLSVRTRGIQAHRVEVDFAGVDMNMGFNRVALEPSGPGRFEGTGMLPVCVRARMTWEAKVLLHTDGGLLAAPFRFDTYLPGKEPSAGPAETGIE